MWNGIMEQAESLTVRTTTRRPLLLRILCISAGVLSAGVVCLSFLTFSFGDQLAGMVIGYNIGFDDFFTGENLMYSSAVALVLSVASFCAIVKIWRLEKFGFWMFCTIQVVALVARFSLAGVLLKIILILLFYRNYKYMTR